MKAKPSMTQPTARCKHHLSIWSVNFVPVSQAASLLLLLLQWLVLWSEWVWLWLENAVSSCICCHSIRRWYRPIYDSACSLHPWPWFLHSMHMSTRLVSNVILTDTPITDFLKTMSVSDFYMGLFRYNTHFVIMLFTLGFRHERYNEVAM